MFMLQKLKLNSSNYMSIQYVLLAFIILYVVLVFNNYETLDIETKGQITFFLVIASIVLFLFYLIMSNSNSRKSDLLYYFKTSAIIALFISIFLLFSSYDKYEIRDNFITDPVNIGIIILFLFCLLNVFDESDDYFVEQVPGSTGETIKVN